MFAPAAFIRVHLQTSGGWRTNVLIPAAYVVLTALVAGLVYHSADERDYSSIHNTFLGLVSGVQGLVLLFLMPGAVRKAVLRDFQSGMMESNRLTPLSGWSLAWGYLLGPGAQALLLFATGLAIGSWFAMQGGQIVGYPGVYVGQWWLAQLCLLPRAALIATLSLVTALASAGKTNLMMLLILVSVVGGWAVVPLVPGLALLSGTMSFAVVLSNFVPLPSGRLDPIIAAWAMVLQAAFALILFRAAVAKIRWPHKPAFDVWLGLLLVLVGAVTLVIGWAYYGDMRWLLAESPASSQWVGSLCALLLLAIVPVLAAADWRCAQDQLHAMTGRLPAVRGLACDLLPLAPTLLAAGTMLALQMLSPVRVADFAPLPGMAVAAAAILVSLWVDYVCAYIARLRGLRLLWPMVGVWGLFRVLPILLDGVVAFVQETLELPRPEHAICSTFSPIGTLIAVAREEPWLTGLVGQVVIAVLLTWGATWVRRVTLNRQIAALGATPAA